MILSKIFSKSSNDASGLPVKLGSDPIAVLKSVRRRRSDEQLRYLSQAVFLEESGSPHSLSHTALVASACVAGFIGWAALAEVNEVAHAPGSVVPSSLEQVVQHLDGGLVRSIEVAPGQLVEPGQLLLTIDDGATSDTFQKTKAKRAHLSMTAQRLQAQIDGRAPDFANQADTRVEDVANQTNLYKSTMFDRESKLQIVETQLAQKKNDMAILDAELVTAQQGLEPVKRLHAARKELYGKELIAYPVFAKGEQDLIRVNGDIERIKEQRKRAEVAIDEFTGRIVSLKQTAHLEDSRALNETMAELKETTSAINMLESRMQRLTLRSPVRGVVKALNVNSIGGVIPPGQTVASIVPVDDELVIDAQITPRDVGHVRAGQKVHVKVSAFDFSRYGVVDATLEQLSATTFASPNGEQYYKGRIRLSKPFVGDDSTRNRIMPGMTIMADIKTGKKTMLEYLLKPVQVATSTAFTEK